MAKLNKSNLPMLILMKIYFRILRTIHQMVAALVKMMITILQSVQINALLIYSNATTIGAAGQYGTVLQRNYFLSLMPLHVA